MTVANALIKGSEKLQNISDAPRSDAERLLLFVIRKKELAWLYAHGNEELLSTHITQYENLIIERATGKPLGYLLGKWEFYGYLFTVNPSVLIPRPSTEELVDEALRYVAYIRRKNNTLNVADIGTGSGCIAITLALELDKLKYSNFNFQIYATDASVEALSIAKLNADKYMVQNKIIFLPGYMMQPIQDKQIDLIVSNPPYVPSSELETQKLQEKETMGLNFEPRMALDGGVDGLQLVNQLLQTKIPVIYETIGGEIRTRNLAYKTNSDWLPN